MKQKILVTGMDIDVEYNRTLIILNGLRKLGYELEIFNFKKRNNSAAETLRSLSQNTLFTFLPSFSHKSVKFVKKNTSSPVVFDPLISKYMTNVKDYKTSYPIGYGALRSTYRDRTSLKHADFVIFDTKTHREYFINKYKIDKGKTGVVYIGTNSVDFGILNTKKTEEFVIGFIGHFIPLHGIFNILKAAEILKDQSKYRFKLIGTGFHFEEAKDYCSKRDLHNVEFLGQVKYEELNNHIANFDVCLGIFSENIKAFHVIPNKIFNYASCGKAIITMDSPAIREIFTHNDNIFLTAPNAEAIAKGITTLAEENERRESLGAHICEVVNTSFKEENIAKSLLDQFQSFSKA